MASGGNPVVYKLWIVNKLSRGAYALDNDSGRKLCKFMAISLAAVNTGLTACKDNNGMLYKVVNSFGSLKGNRTNIEFSNVIGFDQSAIKVTKNYIFWIRFWQVNNSQSVKIKYF